MQGSLVRIVAVSSGVHKGAGFDVDDLHFRRRPYNMPGAYHQSKLCNILFIKELANRLAAYMLQFHLALPTHDGATEPVSQPFDLTCVHVNHMKPMCICGLLYTLPESCVQQYTYD